MAEDQDNSSKTEEPSEHKLSEAKKEGNVFTSKEVTAFLSFLAFLIFLLWMAPWMTYKITQSLKPLIALPDQIILTRENPAIAIWHAVISLIQTIALPVITILGMLAIVGCLSFLLQHGIIYAPKVIMPKLERISPFAGLKRIFSLSMVVEMLKGLTKILLVGWAIYKTLKPEMHNIINSSNLELGGMVLLILQIIIKVMITVCIIMFFLAVADYLYQRNKYMQKMRMTKQEVKEEYKRYEGSPETKSRFRSLRHKKAKERMSNLIPKADVLITNPTHYAAALKYDIDNMPAPQLIAKGFDEIALEMRKIAREHNIPIVENPTLARRLYYSLKQDDFIKIEHYKAVADIISYIMKLRTKNNKKTK